MRKNQKVLAKNITYTLYFTLPKKVRILWDCLFPACQGLKFGINRRPFARTSKSLLQQSLIFKSTYHTSHTTGFQFP